MNEITNMMKANPAETRRVQQILGVRTTGQYDSATQYAMQNKLAEFFNQNPTGRKTCLCPQGLETISFGQWAFGGGCAGLGRNCMAY